MRREINILTGEEIELPDAPIEPEPSVDLDQLDQGTLNRMLIEEGSVVRGLAEIVFGVVKGTIPVNPSITKQQFINLLKSKMRTP